MKMSVKNSHIRKPEWCRIIAVLVVLTLMLIPFSQLYVMAAESGECGENLTWTLNGGRLTISGTGTMTDYSDARMPPWYEMANTITSIVIEEGVTSIGELAFFDCKNLKNAVLPETLKDIGIRAFKDCSSLKYLNFPSSLYSINESAFENCVSLNGVRLKEGVVVIADKAFFRCSSLTDITVPESVNFFGMVVFAYCTSLIRADIRCPINKLPDWTFYDCKNLVSVALPEQITEIGADAFCNCDNISSIHYMGEDLDSIQEQISSDSSGTKTVSGGVVNWDMSEEINGSVIETNDHKTTSATSVTETENSNITTTQTVNYDDELKKVTADTYISATVDNEEGLNELAVKIDELYEEREKLDVSGEMTVEIQLQDVEITGEWLSQYAEKDIVIEVTAESGSSWQIDMNDVKEEDIKKDAVYSMEYVMSESEQRGGIETDTVYKVNFVKETKINTQVGINLGSDYARHYATLYQKSGSSSEAIQNVMIDETGKASFAVANVDNKTDYYVGIDASGVTFVNATIPKSLSSEFGNVYENSLPKYEITGRVSKWGITGGQFALYAGLAIGFIIAVVTVVMIFVNKMKSRRLQEAGGAPVQNAEQKPQKISKIKK